MGRRAARGGEVEVTELDPKSSTLLPMWSLSIMEAFLTSSTSRNSLELRFHRCEQTVHTPSRHHHACAVRRVRRRPGIRTPSEPHQANGTVRAKQHETVRVRNGESPKRPSRLLPHAHLYRASKTFVFHLVQRIEVVALHTRSHTSHHPFPLRADGRRAQRSARSVTGHSPTPQSPITHPFDEDDNDNAPTV